MFFEQAVLPWMQSSNIDSTFMIGSRYSRHIAEIYFGV